MALELKTGEKTAKSVKIPTKTKVNLCKKEPKSRNVATLVIGIAAILALSLCVAKFGVIDQLARLQKAETEYYTVHSQYVAMQQAVAEYPDVEAEYRTYSRNWMKSEDGNGFVKVDRQEILDLIEGYVMPRGTVKNVSIQDSTVIVTMSGMSLTEISDMFDRLKEQPIVADARLTTALTPELDNTENLDFSFIITVQKAEEDGQ